MGTIHDETFGLQSYKLTSAIIARYRTLITHTDDWLSAGWSLGVHIPSLGFRTPTRKVSKNAPQQQIVRLPPHSTHLIPHMHNPQLKACVGCI
ncbi:hypothetical protein VTO73DRAFT_15184 [Trametes versicolor]